MDWNFFLLIVKSKENNISATDVKGLLKQELSKNPFFQWKLLTKS